MSCVYGLWLAQSKFVAYSWVKPFIFDNDTSHRLFHGEEVLVFVKQISKGQDWLGFISLATCKVGWVPAYWFDNAMEEL